MNPPDTVSENPRTARASNTSWCYHTIIYMKPGGLCFKSRLKNFDVESTVVSLHIVPILVL